MKNLLMSKSNTLTNSTMNSKSGMINSNLQTLSARKKSDGAVAGSKI